MRRKLSASSRNGHVAKTFSISGRARRAQNCGLRSVQVNKFHPVRNWISLCVVHVRLRYAQNEFEIGFGRRMD